MMKAIGHDDETHLAQRIERRAHFVGGRAGAMHPESSPCETNNRRPGSLTDPPEPHRTFGDPDRIGYDFFKDVGKCHDGRLAVVESYSRRDTMVMAATISIALVLPSLVVEGTRKFESNNLHARH